MFYRQMMAIYNETCMQPTVVLHTCETKRFSHRPPSTGLLDVGMSEDTLHDLKFVVGRVRMCDYHYGSAQISAAKCTVSELGLL